MLSADLTSIEAITRLTSSDLLLANVTIITGILILLTVVLHVNREHAVVLKFTIYSILLFITSTALLFAASVPGWRREEVFTASGVVFIIGLIYLVITLLYLVRAIAKS